MEMISSFNIIIFSMYFPEVILSEYNEARMNYIQINLLKAGPEPTFT